MPLKRALPPRLHLKRNSYYWTPRLKDDSSSRTKVKWIPLGKDLAKALDEYERLESGKGFPGSVAELISKYEETILPRFKSRDTHRNYKRSLKYLRAALGHIPAAELRPHHIYAYLDAEPNLNRLVAANRDIKVLSAVLSKSKRWEGLGVDFNVCLGIELNPETPRDRYITDQEFITIRTHLPPMFQIAMDISYLTSIRKSDMLLLNANDIYQHKSGDLLQITQQKTKETYSVQADELILDVFEQAKALAVKPDSYLIQKSTNRANGRAGDPYTSSGFDSTWQRYIRKIEKEFGLPNTTWHDIRAKAASDLDSPYHAHRLLGHKSMATTERYLRRRKRDEVPSAGRLLR